MLLNQQGFIVTTASLDTNIAGVVAAGDTRWTTKQFVSAAGEGATVALMARQYLHVNQESNVTAAVEEDIPPISV